jgi:hypothetical protein
MVIEVVALVGGVVDDFTVVGLAVVVVVAN